jgi:hypothetical protein
MQRRLGGRRRLGKPKLGRGDTVHLRLGSSALWIALPRFRSRFAEGVIFPHRPSSPFGLMRAWFVRVVRDPLGAQLFADPTPRDRAASRAKTDANDSVLYHSLPRFASGGFFGAACPEIGASDRVIAFRLRRVILPRTSFAKMPESDTIRPVIAGP